MSKDEDPFEHRVSEAKKANPGVNGAVVTRIKALLNAEMSQQQLSPKRLATISMALITDIEVPAPEKTKASHED